MPLAGRSVRTLPVSHFPYGDARKRHSINSEGVPFWIESTGRLTASAPIANITEPATELVILGRALPCEFQEWLEELDASQAYSHRA